MFDLSKWASKDRDPREIHAIEAINSQSDRISQRVQQMVDAVRVRGDPLELRKERFDLGDLADEVVSRFAKTHPPHQVRLQREGYAPVEADREKIQEVLGSYLDYAIRLSPKDGDINVRI